MPLPILGTSRRTAAAAPPSGPAPALDPIVARWAPENNVFLPPATDLSGGVEDIAAAVTCVPTYHACSLYWPASNAALGSFARVRYKPKSSLIWREGLFALFDAWERPDPDNQPLAQFHTSLFPVIPGTEYEGRIKIVSGAGAGDWRDFEFTTWTEVAEQPLDPVVTELPGFSDQMLTIGSVESGAPDAMHLITFSDANGGAEVDVDNAARHAVLFDNVQNIIVRGLTMRGGETVNCMFTDGCDNIVIDGTQAGGNFAEATNWGSGPDVLPTTGNSRDGAFGNEDTRAGGTGRHEDVGRITIQRYTIRAPRWTSNSWTDGHPEGPNATFFWNTKGNNVFRFIDAVASTDGSKYLKDGFAGGNNQSDRGHMNRDTDHYCIRVERVWDDGFEFDGGTRECRVWECFVNHTFHFCSMSPIHNGQAILKACVMGESRKFEGQPQASGNGGHLVKYQARNKDSGEPWGGGRGLVVNCTCLQDANQFGANGGLHNEGVDSRTPQHSASFNNLLDTTERPYRFGGDPDNAYGNEIDHEIIWPSGKAVFFEGANANGREARPSYLNGTPVFATFAGDAELAVGSPGYGEGRFVEGMTLDVNAGTEGNPIVDCGAHQRGRAALQFGVSAYL